MSRCRWLVCFVLAVVPAGAWAASNAYDRASNAAYNGASWPDGSNGGFGFGPWSFSTVGGAAGRFVGNSTFNNSGDPAFSGPDGFDVNTSGPGTNADAAFGLYANAFNESYATRPFTGALSPGQTFTLRFDNGNINSGARVGFRLLNDSNEARLNVFFRGGDGQYTAQGADGGAFSNTSINFTRSGVAVTFTLLDANSGTLTLRRQISGETSNQLISLGGSASSGITRVQLYNVGAGSGGTFDAFFNEPAIPEPTSTALAALACLALARRRS